MSLAIGRGTMTCANGNRIIAAALSDTALRSRSSWALSPARLPWTNPPFPTAPEEEGSSSEESEGVSLRLLPSSGTRPDPYRVTSPGSEASSGSPSSPSFVSLPSDQSMQMDPLSARGKGQYTCPEGRRCTKGGLQPNGTMIVFERNSAFRYVMRLRPLEPTKGELSTHSRARGIRACGSGS